MKYRQLVLIIEEEPGEQELYSNLLWYNGFDVVVARDRGEGLDLVRERRPDVVVIDLVSARLDGITFCTRLRENPGTAAIPVVVLTGPPQRDLGARAQEVGCAACLEKPVSPLLLMQKIEELVGRPPPAGEVGERALAARDARGDPQERPGRVHRGREETGRMVADSRPQHPGRTGGS